MSTPALSVPAPAAIKQRLDSVEYLISPPALLKLTIIVVNITNSCLAFFALDMFYYVLSHVCLFFSVFTLWLHLCVLDESLKPRWTLYEMALSGVFTVLNFTAATRIAVAKIVELAVFGFISAFLYGFEAYTKIQELAGTEVTFGSLRWSAAPTASPRPTSECRPAEYDCETADENIHSYQRQATYRAI